MNKVIIIKSQQTDFAMSMLLCGFKIRQEEVIFYGLQCMEQTLVSKMEVYVGYSVWSKPLYLSWRSLCGLQCMEQTFVSEMEQFVWETRVWSKPL